MSQFDSIDIYVNYSCNLRCEHCFLGDFLSRKETMSKETILAIANYCRDHFSTTEVVLLGGEPTLHKEILTVIASLYELGIETIRVVTNGSKSCQKFLTAYDARKPRMVFSIDGASPEVHDLIRGDGAFADLSISISMAIERGFEVGGIASICSINADDATNILAMAATLGIDTITFHYVAPRETLIGCAKPLSPQQWLEVRQAILETKHSHTTLVRFDTIFNETTKNGNPENCRIRRANNPMFFADGTVHHCGLLINSGVTGGFLWTNQQLIPNKEGSELSLVRGSSASCPAMELLLRKSEHADSINQFCLTCIYDKDEI